MNVTAFYAWQSDRPSKVNRNLIRNAAEAACQRITEDESNHWSLKIDSDTQGVAGMCDIPNTILEKIKNCSMFLADLTFVGNTDDDLGTQQMPNSNVLFELGFAAICLGFDSLIGVVNEAYGKIEGLIFDIKRRSSLSYSVPEDADSSTIAKQQERLSRQLEEVFRITLETIVKPKMAEADRDHEQEFKNLQSDFAGRVKQGKFHDYRKLPATLLTIQTSVLNKLEYDDLFEQVRRASRNARPSEDAVYWSDEGQIAELGTNGVLLHAYGGVYESFKSACHLGTIPYAYFHSGEPIPQFLPAIPLQMKIVYYAFAQCQLLTTLKLPLPWFVGVSLVGANGFKLITDSYESPKAIDQDEIHFPPFVIESLDQMADHRSVAGCLRETLNRLCRKVGWERSDCFTSQGVWNQRFFGDWQ